jgi:hypothetical protein
MLRALIAALLLANLGFYAWSQGWLDDIVGVHAAGDHEPERLSRQVRPDTVRILAAGSAIDAASAAPVTALPTFACLEAGPFSDAELSAAQTAAQSGLPGTTLADVKVDKPGVWLVYMGRYATRDAMIKKEDELRRRNTPFDEVREPAALAPGLSLGRFGDRAAANKALDSLSQQGVHTARVVELTPASSSHVLRLDKADSALAGQATALKLAGLGKGFAPCARP